MAARSKLSREVGERANKLSEAWIDLRRFRPREKEKKGKINKERMKCSLGGGIRIGGVRLSKELEVVPIEKTAGEEKSVNRTLRL